MTNKKTNYSHMKNNYLSLLLFLVISGFLVGCSGSNAAFKRGERLATAGFHNEAAEFFMRSVAANRTNVEARQALQRSGQLTLEKMFDGMFVAHASEKHKEVVNIWQDADRYRQRVSRHGVELEMPARFETMFLDSKDIHLNELFLEGENHMAEENFTAAERVFREISKLEPDFKNVGELKNVAIVEPRYREGVLLFDRGRYREAYGHFKVVQEKSPNYKDTKRFIEDCLVFGQFPVIVEPFENAASDDKNVGNRISALITNALAGKNDPFIKVVDRRNLDRVLEEQRLAMAGIARSNSNFSEIVAAAASISGTIIEFNRSEGRLQRAIKSGFESYMQQYQDEEGRTRSRMQYRPVQYLEFSQTNTVSISVQYQLISMQSGQVLATDLITISNQDVMGYVEYDGNARNLIPANANGEMNTNRQALNNLRQLMNGKRTIAPIEALATDLYRDAANRIAMDIKSKVDNI
jgi:tetratricopeptide (TPR) repeat protein